MKLSFKPSRYAAEILLFCFIIVAILGSQAL